MSRPTLPFSSKNLRELFVQWSKNADEIGLLCRRCQSASLEKIVNLEGEVAVWRCPHCGYAL